MKKTLIAVAALAATGAFAQVSVYGRLDAGYANTVTTTNNVETKANGVQSHNSVSSMWGIQGSEDLGGGMKAIFKLEQDLYVANGNTGTSGAGTVSTYAGQANASGFNRTSLIGLSGAFGTVSFGRDYNPVFKLIGATDVNSLSRISTVQNAGATGGTSQANMVMYSTPNMSGFQVNLAYSNQDNSIGGTPATDVTSKITNVTATYANGPLMVGVGAGSTEARSGTAAAGFGQVNLWGAQIAGISLDKTAGTVLAASYDFGKFKLAGHMSNSKLTLANNVGDIEAKELNVGATMPMGKVTLVAQVGQNTVASPGSQDAKGTDYVIGADYALSAKTALFAKTGTFNKFSVDNGVDTKTTSTAVGIKTTF